MGFFYGRRAWQRLRKQVLHDAGYQCVRCGASLIGKGRGAHVHHRKYRKRAPALALEPQNLIAVCVDCHSHIHANENTNTGCDESGMPLHPAHPWNAAVGGRSENPNHLSRATPAEPF